MRARQPFKRMVRNFEIVLILAHFSAKYIKFQILLEQPIFVVQRRLIYEKASIFDGKYDAIKILSFQFFVFLKSFYLVK